LALYHYGGTLLAWDLESRERILHLPHNNALMSCAFTPDNRALVTGYNPDRLVFRDLKSGETNQTFATRVVPHHLALSRDGQRLAL
jgi:WD40 repeat protein